jgi:hypothetical protein
VVYGRRRRRDSPATGLPRRRGRRSKESGATEPGLGHGLAQMNERGMRDTTRPKIWARQVSGRRWAQRRRVGVAEHASERRPSLGLGLGASKASAKGKGRVTGSHRGRWEVEIVTQTCRRRGLAVALGGARGGGCWGLCLAPGSPRADSGMCCEDDPTVRELQGSLGRENCGGATTHRRRLRSKFRRGARRNLGDEISRSVAGP